MKRTLTLRSEALAELTPDQLTGVVGAALPTTPVGVCDPFETLRATRCFCP